MLFSVTTSPLFTTWAAAARSTHDGPEDPRNGECGRSSRSRFVYVGPRAASLYQPAARIPASRSHATLSIVFCFRNADTYVDGSGLRPWSRREVAFLFVCMRVFCSVFAGSRRSRAHPFIARVEKEVIMT